MGSKTIENDLNKESKSKVLCFRPATLFYNSLLLRVPFNLNLEELSPLIFHWIRLKMPKTIIHLAWMHGPHL